MQPSSSPPFADEFHIFFLFDGPRAAGYGTVVVILYYLPLYFEAVKG